MDLEFDQFMDWMLQNVEMAKDGYLWIYEGEYYTSKQLLSIYKTIKNE